MARTVVAPPASPDSDRPSKSQRKRDSHELQALGEALAALAPAQRAAVPMPDALREALDEWQRTRSHEGRRRQMQLIGKLMRHADPAPLREAVARAKLPGARATLTLHRLEQLREALVADDAALARFADGHPAADLQRLRSLVRAARQDGAAVGERRPRAWRELFAYLKETCGDE